MTELNILLTTAVTIAFVHTLIGIDHYVPFVALSRANSWTMKKTMLIVFVCGLGHVLSSVVLGCAGIALSAGVSLLVDIEGIRGEIASYFLIAFGLVYTVYGVRAAVKKKTHSHLTPDGHTITHAHSANGENHEHATKKPANVFWGLFILFILGPCEPLIPVLMYPAAMHNVFALVLVTVCFAIVTISTMAVMTFMGVKGVHLLKINALEQYSHALAGFAVFVCGVSLLVLPI
ncbi:MAG: sulfite exporter TauE/SafE family protein [Treponema sp.]|nr:sulfite exporter TauE/SafE family protein [Treponema sp.]